MKCCIPSTHFQGIQDGALLYPDTTFRFSAASGFGTSYNQSQVSLRAHAVWPGSIVRVTEIVQVSSAVAADTKLEYDADAQALGAKIHSAPPRRHAVTATRAFLIEGLVFTGSMPLSGQAGDIGSHSCTRNSMVCGSRMLRRTPKLWFRAIPRCASDAILSIGRPKSCSKHATISQPWTP